MSSSKIPSVQDGSMPIEKRAPELSGGILEAELDAVVGGFSVGNGLHGIDTPPYMKIFTELTSSQGSQSSPSGGGKGIWKD